MNPARITRLLKTLTWLPLIATFSCSEDGDGTNAATSNPSASSSPAEATSRDPSAPAATDTRSLDAAASSTASAPGPSEGAGGDGGSAPGTTEQPSPSNTSAGGEVSGPGGAGGASSSGDGGEFAGGSPSNEPGGSGGEAGTSRTEAGSGGEDGSPSGGDGGLGEGGTNDGGAAGSGSGDSDLDVFGIEQLYPSAPSGLLWTSEHWNEGSAYPIDSRRDPMDPLGLSGMRGTGELTVDGMGELLMSGSQPRIYVYPPEGAVWRDTEITVYYRRVEDAAVAYAGLVIGVRSGPEGHGDTPCDAHTYYSRLRHDGAADFEKELMHSPSSTRERIQPEVVWPPDGELPTDVWIGWKFVIYNVGTSAVQLEAYRDLTGGVDGGTWEKINETVDEGGWFTDTTCDEHSPVNGESDLVVVDGGTAFVRNTDVTEARYRWLSIREIAP